MQTLQCRVMLSFCIGYATWGCYVMLHYVGLCSSVTESLLYAICLSYFNLHIGFVLPYFTLRLVAWHDLGIHFFAGLRAPVKISDRVTMSLCVCIAQRMQKLWFGSLLHFLNSSLSMPPAIWSPDPVGDIFVFTWPHTTCCKKLRGRERQRWRVMRVTYKRKWKCYRQMPNFISHYLM